MTERDNWFGLSERGDDEKDFRATKLTRNS